MQIMLWTVLRHRLFWYIVFNIQEDTVDLFSALISWNFNFFIQRNKELLDHKNSFQFHKTSPTININFLCNYEVYI